LRYHLCVENAFDVGPRRINRIEHYFLAELVLTDGRSRGAHLAQVWLALDGLAEVDLRLHVLRDALADGSYATLRHLVADDAKA
jgi:hypothetical protein